MHEFTLQFRDLISELRISEMYKITIHLNNVIISCNELIEVMNTCLLTNDYDI